MTYTIWLTLKGGAVRRMWVWAESDAHAVSFALHEEGAANVTDYRVATGQQHGPMPA